MTFEEASDMYAMYSIDPQLTCQCDDVHTCQQCYEENERDISAHEDFDYEGCNNPFSFITESPIRILRLVVSQRDFSRKY